MIAYSAGVKKAIEYLFRPYNDIDVYVEDTNSRNMYEILLTRMLGNRGRISRVFQLGSRDQVLSACRADQAPGGRRRLYIIDGDFDYVLQAPVPRLRHLYRLQAYTSENLVFCGHAALEVACDAMPNTAKSDIQARIGFDAFRSSVVQYLIILFQYYVAIQLMGENVQSVNYNVSRLCNDTGACLELCPVKIAARCSALDQDLRARHPVASVNEALRQAQTLLSGTVDLQERCISGKTYLLPLLYHLLHRKAGYRGTKEQLKVSLARYCRLDIEPGLQRALIRAAARIRTV
jgi:hypothetical protein